MILDMHSRYALLSRLDNVWPEPLDDWELVTKRLRRQAHHLFMMEVPTLIKLLYTFGPSNFGLRALSDLKNGRSVVRKMLVFVVPWCLELNLLKLISIRLNCLSITLMYLSWASGCKVRSEPVGLQRAGDMFRLAMLGVDERVIVTLDEVLVTELFLLMERPLAMAGA